MLRNNHTHASWRLAVSNGWAFTLPALPGQTANGEAAAPATPAAAAATPTPAAAPTSTTAGAVDASGGDTSGLLAILAVSVVASYVIKYGETLLPFVADGESVAVPVAATLMIVAASGFNCWKWQQRSQDEADFGGLI